MDYMMYSPRMDEDTILIANRIEKLGRFTSGWNDGGSDARLAKDELLGMGKYIAGHLLNAWENPPQSAYVNFSLQTFYRNLDNLLVQMIERDDLTLEQLQRYRRLITSEKL